MTIVKKCSPKLICVENVTATLLFVILLVVSFLAYQHYYRYSTHRAHAHTEHNAHTYAHISHHDNPYSPPLTNETPSANYRQVGIIIPMDGQTTSNILPLMGRPIHSGRDKWQYYTISNQHNNVKLPITFKGRSGLEEYGVDKIYSGDTIYVEGYNQAFSVTAYENNIMRYLPL